jgi:hypothetical protein
MSATYESVVNAAFAIVNLTDEQKKELLLKLLKNDPEPVIAALRSDNEKPIQLEDKYCVVLFDGYSNYRIKLIKEYRSFHNATLAESNQWWNMMITNDHHIFAGNLCLDVATNLKSLINAIAMEEIADVEQQIKEA